MIHLKYIKMLSHKARNMISNISILFIYAVVILQLENY
jgi:hypothetical protein